jgi:hypothetical protein
MKCSKCNLIGHNKRKCPNELDVSKTLELDTNILNNEILETEEKGSDVEPTFIWRDKKLKERNGAGYFNYYNKLDKIDLSRYGIYKNSTETNNYELNCLEIAILNSGIAKDKFDKLKNLIRTRNIPKKDLRIIAEKLEIYIILKKLDNNYNNVYYGDKNNQHIEIGLLNNHYFIIEKTNYTSYSIENYFKIQNLNNWNYIISYDKKRKVYIRNNKSCINSFKLIKILLENKQTHLEEINMTNCGEFNSFHNRNFDYEVLSNISEVLKIVSFDISKINEKTELIGNTFKTIDELKMCTDRKKVILYITRLKPSSIKDYLSLWIYKSYYSKQFMFGNLTNRIKKINNGICYTQIMNHCFNAYDIKRNMVSKNILNTRAINIVKEFYDICPSMCGIFIDYLIRRIISELMNIPFNDSRANNILNNDNIISYHSDNENIWEYLKNDKWGNWLIKKEPLLSSNIVGEIIQCDKFIAYEKKDEWLKIKYKNIDGWVRWKLPIVSDEEKITDIECYSNPSSMNKYIQKVKGDNIHICSKGCKYDIEQTKYFGFPEYINTCYLEYCQYISYEKVKDTKQYKTVDILYDIFATSLCHIESFGSCPNQEIFNAFYNKLKSITIDYFVGPLFEMCKTLIHDKTNILLNPALGEPLTNLKNASIPADADLVIDDSIYDIKCTKKGNEYYEVLQLLGYSGLLLLNEKFEHKINNMIILNILEGTLINYNISYLEKDNFIKYIQLLTKQQI